MDKHPECPDHPGIYLTCDNTAMGLRWKCTIHGCTVVGWGDLDTYKPANYETRQARTHACQRLAHLWLYKRWHQEAVYWAMREKFGTWSIHLCDKETCEKIIEWAKGL